MQSSIEFQSNRRRFSLLLPLTFSLLIFSLFQALAAVPQIGQVAPVHRTTTSSFPSIARVPSVDQLAQEVDVYAIQKSEPAPIGIADYGIGTKGPYEYKTSSFLGNTRIYSLSAQDSSGNPVVSLQLNVNLLLVTNSGLQSTYWIQDVAQLDTHNHAIRFVDNIWNQSAFASNMSSSAISGNGQVISCNCSLGSTFYYEVAGSSYPGNLVYYSYPLTVLLEVNSSLNSLGEPQVRFYYNDGYGWQNYDTTTFIQMKNTSSSEFYVTGHSYNPRGTFDDAELVIGGGGNGQNTTLQSSNLQLSLEYWNHHNYQAIVNAFNFGSDTAEGVQNAISNFSHSGYNGSLFAQVSLGSGTLGKLYTQEQVSTINIETSPNSGILYIGNFSTASSSRAVIPFIGGEINATIYPGEYVFYVYDMAGTLNAERNVNVSTGENLTVNSELQVTFVLDYSVKGEVPIEAPVFAYYSGGQKTVVTLGTSPSTYYLDPGSPWSVTEVINGTSGVNRWITQEGTAGYAELRLNATFVYFYQLLINISYTVIGGGEMPTPNASISYLGSPTNVSLSTTPNPFWVDENSFFRAQTLISGSMGERWATNQVFHMISSSGTIRISYYHQFQISLSYRIPGGGEPTVPTNITLFGTMVSVGGNSTIWVDSGGAYSFPASVEGSTPLERWEYVGNAESLSGLVNSPTNFTLPYLHQFYVTIKPSGSSGTVSPTSGWFNASDSIRLDESNFSGWGKGGWVGSGLGSYSGESPNPTISISGPITEIGQFIPGLSIATTDGGSVSFSYGTRSGVVQPASSTLLYVPNGTEVKISSRTASFLYSFSGWNGNFSGKASSLKFTVNSPTVARAIYSYNFTYLGILVSLPIVVGLLLIFIAIRRPKSP